MIFDSNNEVTAAADVCFADLYIVVLEGLNYLTQRKFNQLRPFIVQVGKFSNTACLFVCSSLKS